LIYFNSFTHLTEFDISNNPIIGIIPQNIPLTLKTLNIHNTFISGTLPSVLGQLPLQSIDISNTLLCGTFPSEWNNIQWVSCNLNIPYPCNSKTTTNPPGCVVADCDETTMCFVDQCQTGSNKCQKGRSCIFDQTKWGYTCSDCNEYIWFNDGSYACKAGYGIILVPIVGGVIIIMIVAIICLKKKFSNDQRYTSLSNTIQE